MFLGIKEKEICRRPIFLSKKYYLNVLYIFIYISKSLKNKEARIRKKKEEQVKNILRLGSSKT